MNPNSLCHSIRQLSQARLIEIWNAANTSDDLSLLTEITDENLGVSRGNTGSDRLAETLHTILAEALCTIICEVDSNPRDWNRDAIFEWFKRAVTTN